MTTTTLTRDQILAMPEGPEMDALVEDRVMGWEKSDPPLPFSIDLPYAWLVVEKAWKDRPFQLYRGSNGLYSVPYWWKDYPDQFNTPPSTACLSICRAALLATLGAEQ